MALASRTNEKTSKEIGLINEKIKGSRLKFSDLAIPIIVVVVLLFLSIFVFIPMINSAFEYQREIKEVDKKIKQLTSLNTQLASLDQNNLNDTVVLAKGVIPKVLKVTDFIYYIDNLAKEKGLLIKELSAGDMGGSLFATQSSGAGVSGPVSYEGDYTNVVLFLEEVQSVSPYIVRIQDVEVAHLATEKWRISLNVSGYYMADKSGDADIYRPFKSYTEYQDILDIFEAKSKNL